MNQQRRVAGDENCCQQRHRILVARHSSRGAQRAFTLIELLVVIAIIRHFGCNAFARIGRGQGEGQEHSMFEQLAPNDDCAAHVYVEDNSDFYPIAQLLG